MPNWNPNFPEVLGLEWLTTRGDTSRVWAGAPARFLRLPSTVAETIAALRASVTVNPLVRHDTRTLIDVIEEGKEVTPLFTPVYLKPNADIVINGWRRWDGLLTFLNLAIDDPTTQWPAGGNTSGQWIQNGLANEDAYECHVNASAFDVGGSLRNARIGFVSISAILGANTGFRKLRVSIVIDGVSYAPAGGSTRDVHGFGAIYTLWYGELNPATGLPWTPADIADFDIGGSSKIRIQTVSTSGTQFPKVWALALEVYCLPIENRVAVGIWRRPETLTQRLNNIRTDALVSVPGGAANWSKPTTKNFLYYFRQCVCPSLFGPVVADDVRWNAAIQDLGPKGQPPGIAYPLRGSKLLPIPTDAIVSFPIAHDYLGRPQSSFEDWLEGWIATRKLAPGAGYGLVLERSDTAFSVDSQPYRLDAEDLERIHVSQKLGQRVTPGTAQTYLGVRLPIIPPANVEAKLRVTVHLVSSGAQVGGTFEISAAAVRALPATAGGIRYVSGFLSSGAALSAATAYEIRLSTDRAPSFDAWLAFMPDCSLGASAGFGGTTDGAFIGSTHFADRDLAVNLVRQPDAPTGATASIVNVPIANPTTEVTTVQHVGLTWTKPATSMGALFTRYEIERSLDGGAFEPVATIFSEPATNFLDREVPRLAGAKYQIRAVGSDGRFSAWASSNTVTPTAPGLLVVLTSNHQPGLEQVYAYDPESSYPILSTGSDETVAIHGSDLQVIFMEDEDRGIGWGTRVTINQVTLTGKGGQTVLRPLLDLVRSKAIPYVCVMNRRGDRYLGHVRVEQVAQADPFHRYTAAIEVIPTHTTTIPAEVTPLVQEDQTLLAFGTVQITGSLAQTQQKQTLAATGTVT